MNSSLGVEFTFYIVHARYKGGGHDCGVQRKGARDIKVFVFSQIDQSAGTIIQIRRI